LTNRNPFHKRSADREGTSPHLGRSFDRDREGKKPALSPGCPGFAEIYPAHRLRFGRDHKRSFKTSGTTEIGWIRGLTPRRGACAQPNHGHEIHLRRSAARTQNGPSRRRFGGSASLFPPETKPQPLPPANQGPAKPPPNRGRNRGVPQKVSFPSTSAAPALPKKTQRAPPASPEGPAAKQRPRQTKLPPPSR